MGRNPRWRRPHSTTASRCVSPEPYTEFSLFPKINPVTGDFPMRRCVRFALALFALTCLAPAALLFGDDDKAKPDAKADTKAAEKPAATEVTTQGSVDVGGQHILYNAIAGTITVGGTD